MQKYQIPGCIEDKYQIPEKNQGTKIPEYQLQKWKIPKYQVILVQIPDTRKPLVAPQKPIIPGENNLQYFIICVL